MAVRLNKDFVEAVSRIRPEAKFFRDVVMEDQADGQGPYLAAWNLSGPPPTDAEIAAEIAASPSPDIRSVDLRVLLTPSDLAAIKTSTDNFNAWSSLLTQETTINTKTAQFRQTWALLRQVLGPPRAAEIAAALRLR